jgi:CBS domain-containing protein
MSELLNIARRPAVTIAPGATVQRLSERMLAERVGAVAVVDGEKLVGIVSERDVVGRVVVERRDPEKTTVQEIMTRQVRTAGVDVTAKQALQVMTDGHFRHLPIADAEGHVLGMLSLRHVLRLRVAELDLRNVDLMNYISADGPGG